MATTLYAQCPTLYQAGAGNIIGATSVTLTTLTDIYGNVLTMANFGALGYFTCEPDSTNAEGGTFTGVTANANGTYSLTGVKTILAVSPYTQTSGLVRSHAGGTKVVITDNVAFWATFANKTDDETITGRWGSAVAPLNANDYVNKTYADGLAIAGSPDSSTTVKGIGRVSVAPASATIPIFVGDNDPRVPTQGENDALVGNNTDIAVGSGNKMVTQTGLQHGAEKYVASASGSSTAYTATLSPVPTSYTAGMEVLVKIDVANTTTNPTLNVNGLGAKTIVRGTATALVVNDLIIGQVARFVYDGTNMVLQNPSTAAIYANGTSSKDASDSSATQTIAHGLGKIPKSVEIYCTLAGAYFNGGSSGVFMTLFANTFYNGTTQSSQSLYSNSGATNTQAATFTLNAANAAATTVGVVTFDATNISIAWTKAGSPTGVYNILWKAVA